MLSTLLAEYPWLARGAFVVLLVAAPFVAAWLLARRRLALVLALVSAAIVVLLTLYPDGRPGLGRCVVSFNPTDLLQVEPLANVVLFVPPVLAFAAAIGRPLPAFVVGAALSALIELLQWVVPAIGRSCTLMDWIANVIGAALGAGLAGLGMLVARRRRRRRVEQGTATAAQRSRE